MECQGAHIEMMHGTAMQCLLPAQAVGILPESVGDLTGDAAGEGGESAVDTRVPLDSVERHQTETKT